MIIETPEGRKFLKEMILIEFAHTNEDLDELRLVLEEYPNESLLNYSHWSSQWIFNPDYLGRSYLYDNYGETIKTSVQLNELLSWRLNAVYNGKDADIYIVPIDAHY